MVDAEILMATIEAGLRHYRPNLLRRAGSLIEFAINSPRIENSPFNRLYAITHGIISVAHLGGGLALKYELRLGGVLLMAVVWAIIGATVGMWLHASDPSLPECVGIGLGFFVVMTAISYWGAVARFRSLLRVWGHQAHRVPA